MDLQQAITRLSAAGVTFHARGERLAVESPHLLTDAQRAWIKDHKSDILAELRKRQTAESKAAPAPFLPITDTPHWRWIVSHAPGDVREHDCEPPVTLAEIRNWYPEALDISGELEGESSHLFAHTPKSGS